MVKNSHAFCEELLTKPESVIEAAPEGPKAAPTRVSAPAPAPQTGNAELDALEEENARLRAEIEAQLAAFPQYQKTKEMIHQRDVEIRGMKARL